MSLAAPEVRPMPGELSTGPARVLAPVQAPPATSAPMPPFPAVDDDPFAPPRPTHPTSPAHAEPSNEPPFQGEVPSSQESTSPASKPSRPTPEEDDPFAPAKPQAGLTPSQDVMPVFASAGKNTPTDLARDADGQLPLRSWVDDTGQFRVQARLIQVLDGHVRLLKTTGRTTTVPLTRLSSADRAYVARAVAYYGQQLLAPQLVAQSPSQP